MPKRSPLIPKSPTDSSAGINAMRERLRNILGSFSASWNKTKSWGGRNKTFIFPFLFSFALMFSFIEATLVRSAMINRFKTELVALQKYLNEFQLDLAYDHIKFNNIFFYPLVEIENLQLYNLRGTELWRLNFDKVSGRLGLLNINKLNFRSSEQILFARGERQFRISGDTALKITANSKGGFETLHLRLRDADIKDFAKIKEAGIDVRNLHSVKHEALIMPSLEGHLEISGVKLNGLLEYPLTSEIKRVYAKATLMGSIPLQDSFLLGTETWLQNGGFVDIPRLVVNWQPLLLVGRGTLNFNEELQPRLSLATSSKAMLNLLDDLQKNKFLDRKGVFVANILLNSKAFKLHEEDKHLTLTTPISYQDNKLAVENITVKTFKP